MRILNFVILAATIGLFLIACQETKTPFSQDGSQAGAGSQITQTNSASGSFHKPANSGPYVFRHEGHLFDGILVVIDYASGTALVLGADPVELCTGTLNYDLVSIMDISVPEDANRIMELVQGKDIHTSIWQIDPNTELSCNDVLNGTPIASGYSNLTSTDNDLLTFLYDTNVNYNAFGFSAHGTLAGPDGEQYAFSAHSRSVWDGVDPASYKETHHISLQ